MSLRSRAAGLAGTALALCAPTPAGAADWSLSGFFSQALSLDAESGETGDDAGDDVALRSTTDVGARIGAQTKRTSWLLAPGVRGTLSTDSEDDNSVLPRFNGSVRHVAPRGVFTASLGVVPDFVDETEFDGIGTTERNLIQVSVSGAMGYTHSIDPRQTLSFGLNGAARTFLDDPETLDETQSVGTSLGWGVALTPRTDGSLTASARYFRSDDRTSATGQTFSLVAGVDHAANRRLSVSFSAGPSYTRSTQDDPLVGGGFAERTEDSFGVVGSAGLSYAADPRTDFALAFEQSVDQDAEGEIENRSSLGLNISHRIDSVSRVGLGASVGVRTAISGDADDTQTFSLGPSYAIDLTDDWSLTAGYRFRTSNDDDGVEYQNSFRISVSRGFDFLQ